MHGLRSSNLAAIAATALCACGASPRSPDAAAGDVGASALSDLLVPQTGALLGHFYGADTVSATDARIGRTPAVHLSYFAWADDWPRSVELRDDLATGRIPLVNWEPDGASGKIDFTAIISGQYDAMIHARAAAAKVLDRKFFLDVAAEMNGDEGWGGHDPERYIAAYRHIHDIFVAEGARNAVWLWAPNVTDVPGGPDAMQYYPGDAYVDWTGVDGYNWGTSDGGTWQTFQDVFSVIYPKLAAKGKPIFIGEMATAPTGGSKASWIAAIIETLKSSFPQIKGFAWFDVDKERDWRINSSPETLAAYRAMANDPYLNP